MNVGMELNYMRSEEGCIVEKNGDRWMNKGHRWRSWVDLVLCEEDLQGVKVISGNQ